LSEEIRYILRRQKRASFLNEIIEFFFLFYAFNLRAIEQLAYEQLVCG
jgi:hypothetical protein